MFVDTFGKWIQLSLLHNVQDLFIDVCLDKRLFTKQKKV